MLAAHASVHSVREQGRGEAAALNALRWELGRESQSTSSELSSTLQPYELLRGSRLYTILHLRITVLDFTARCIFHTSIKRIGSGARQRNTLCLLGRYPVLPPAPVALRNAKLAHTPSRSSPGILGCLCNSGWDGVTSPQWFLASGINFERAPSYFHLL